jgi:hypothetical protein
MLRVNEGLGLQFFKFNSFWVLICSLRGLTQKKVNLGVPTSVVCVNGLGLNTLCKCKNKYIYIDLCALIKQHKCKYIYIYIILHGYVKTI